MSKHLDDWNNRHKPQEIEKVDLSIKKAYPNNNHVPPIATYGIIRDPVTGQLSVVIRQPGQKPKIVKPVKAPKAPKPKVVKPVKIKNVKSTHTKLIPEKIGPSLGSNNWGPWDAAMGKSDDGRIAKMQATAKRNLVRRELKKSIAETGEAFTIHKDMSGHEHNVRIYRGWETDDKGNRKWKVSHNWNEEHEYPSFSAAFNYVYPDGNTDNKNGDKDHDDDDGVPAGVGSSAGSAGTVGPGGE